MDMMKMEEMRFFGYHGVFAEENKLGQQFAVSLDLHLDLHEAGRTDNLEATVNYAEVYETVRKLAEGPPFKLIEALSESIASAVLNTYTRVNAVTVKVRKPHPPFAIHFDGVVVEIYRERDTDV